MNKLRNKEGATWSIIDINSVSSNIEANEVHFEKINVKPIEILSDDETNSKNLKVSKNRHIQDTRRYIVLRLNTISS